MARLSLMVSGKVQLSCSNIHAYHPVDAARNQAYEQMCSFEERSGRPVEWMIMFDNDVAPPDGWINLFDSIPDDADIVILPYPVWLSGNAVPTICVGDWKNGEMVTRIDMEDNAWNRIEVGGTGAMMIRRRVFKDGRLKPPFFKIIADEKKGQTVSEDIWFTARVHEAGFKLYTHTGYACSHFRTTDLLRVNYAINKVIKDYETKVREICRAQGVEIGTMNEVLRPELA